MVAVLTDEDMAGDAVLEMEVEERYSVKDLVSASDAVNVGEYGYDIAARIMQSRLGTLSMVDEMDKRAEYYADKSAKYVWDQFRYELKYKQVEILERVARGEDVAIMSGHKCGKTFALACCVIYFLDIKGPCSKVLTTAPGERQLKHILWAEIGHLYNRWKRKNEFEKTTGMHLYHRRYYDDWSALGVYSNHAAKIEGFHTKEEGKFLCVMDEAKTIPEEFFIAVASMQGQNLVASTPPLDGQGYYPRIFTDFRELWSLIHMSTLQSPLVQPKWIEARKKDWVEGSPVWEAKIEGRIPTIDATNLVVSVRKVEEAQERWNDKDQVAEFRSVIGCDIARFGADLTVAVIMRDCRVSRIKVAKKQGLMATVGMLTELAYQEALMMRPPEHALQYAKESIPIGVDDTGLNGVTDRLIELEYNVHGINFATKSGSPIYGDKPSELWFSLAADLDELSLPPDDAFEGAAGRMITELTSRRFKYTSTGKKIDPKEIAKKYLAGRSPDHADALVIANMVRRPAGEPDFGVEVW